MVFKGLIAASSRSIARYAGAPLRCRYSSTTSIFSSLIQRDPSAFTRQALGLHPGANPSRLFSSTALVRNTSPSQGKDEKKEVAADDKKADDGVKATKRPMAAGEDVVADEETVVVKVKPKSASQKNPLGYFNVTGIVLFFAGLGLLISYKRRLQVAVDKFKEENETQSYGKALIGGPFKLTDTNGETFTEENLKGKFSLIYFGFTLCPDVCPEELDKMAIIIKELGLLGIPVQPIFITCDPLRDSPAVVKRYLEEFEIPGIVGLTGTHEEIEAACKAYRVYFSTPPEIKPGEDYIVDHSIFFYLMDPEGQFMNVYGRRYNATEATREIAKKILKWRPAAERLPEGFVKPSIWKFWE